MTNISYIVTLCHTSTTDLRADDDGLSLQSRNIVSSASQRSSNYESCALSGLY